MISAFEAMVKTIRDPLRERVRALAVPLNKLTGGRLNPNAVTIAGFAMHLPIAVLIATGHWVGAALLLVVFGLLDSIDGALARLQKRETNVGGLLDASTDRLKEVLLYIGAAYWFAGSAQPMDAVWAVAACGASLCVSYIKSKGETMAASQHRQDHANGKQSYAQLNRLFADDIAPFEGRMLVLWIGLLTGYLTWAVIILAAVAGYAALLRLARIAKAFM